MIKLIFHNENYSLKEEVSFPDGYDYVLDLSGEKDLDFINHNISKIAFKDISNKINQIDISSLNLLDIEFSNTVFDNIGKVKACVHRIIGYSYGGEKYEEREVLSIKFIPDNNYIIEDYIVYCNNNCQYINLEKGFCKKYNKKLINKNNKCLVCKLCYLSVSDLIIRQLKEEEYNSISSKLKI